MDLLYILYIDRGRQLTPEKKALTLNLPVEEMEALEAFAARKDVSKTAVLRQALRLLLHVEARRSTGGKIMFEDTVRGEKTELLPL